jgi:hypothetical protein
MEQNNLYSRAIQQQLTKIDKADPQLAWLF